MGDTALYTPCARETGRGAPWRKAKNQGHKDKRKPTTNDTLRIRTLHACIIRPVLRRLSWWCMTATAKKAGMWAQGAAGPKASSLVA